MLKRHGCRAPENEPMETADGLPTLRDVIARSKLTARKSLGQNFLLDFNLIRRIARAAAPLEEYIVVEVGAGPGGLTRALFLEGAGRVIAVETDHRCRQALGEIAQRYPDRRFAHHPLPRRYCQALS